MSISTYTKKQIESVSRSKLVTSLLEVKAVDTDTSSTVSLEALKPYVMPAYDSVFEAAVESRIISPDLPAAFTFHIVAAVDPLKLILNANGRNRRRNWHHVTDLAWAMQTGFRPCLTDCAITLDQKTANAGHSVAAFFAAFLPLDFFAWARVEGVRELVPDSADSLEPEYRTVFKTPPLRKDADTPAEGFIQVERTTGLDLVETETGELVAEFTTWNDEQRAEDYQGYIDRAFESTPHLAEFRICVNVEPHAVTAYDTIARGRQADEQLYLFSPTRQWETDRDWLDLKSLSQILKALHLRCKASPVALDDAQTAWSYGSNKGGGRTNPSHFPGFALANVARLAKCDYVRQHFGEAGSLLVGSSALPALFAVPSENPPALCPIRANALKDVATVLASITVDQIHAMVERLQASKPDVLVKKINARLTDDGSGNWVRPSADWIQSALVMVAKGAEKLPLAKELPTFVEKEGGESKRAELYQLTAARGHDWDCGEKDKTDGDYLIGAVHPAMVLVDDYFGESGKDSRAEAFRPKRKNKRRAKKS